MIIDKKGRLFGKVNILDICILVVIIAVAVVVYTKFSKKAVITDVTQEVTITIQCDEAPDFVKGFIKEGDLVVDDSKNVTLGKVVSVNTAPSISYAANSEGKMVKSSKEGYYSVVIQTTVNAQPFSNGIIIDGNKYMVNHSLTVRAGTAKLWAKISYIVLKGDEQK